ncbi:MAG: flagellar basal body P-ring formation chaperone FlgA [Pseudomonadota bacterium]
MLARIVLITALALAAAPAIAQPAPDETPRSVVLKERLVTHDHVVSLADLFTLSEGDVDAPLARIAEPGERLSIDPDYVRSVAARAGLNWANASGLLRITVERAGRAVAASDIASMIEGALFVEHGEAHEVTLSNRALVMHAPIDTVGGPELLALDYDARSGLFRAEIAAWPGGERRTIAGRAMAVLDIPVLARPLARGEVISEDAIDWARLPAARIRGDALVNPDQLIGQEARRALRPGEPVRASDLKTPAAITRGETVALVFEVGALTLTARARAMNDAAVGETARFVNLQSNRTVEAVVEAPGRARVHGLSARPA